MTAVAGLAGVHRGWAWVVIVGNGVAGLWALGAGRWSSLRVPALWWFTAGAEVAAFLEVGLGVATLGGRDTSDLQFHMFYGFLTLVGVGILYSYRQQLRERIYQLYGWGGLFLMGLALRAVQVGPR